MGSFADIHTHSDQPLTSAQPRESLLCAVRCIATPPGKPSGTEPYLEHDDAETHHEPFIQLPGLLCAHLSQFQDLDGKRFQETLGNFN